MRYAIVGYGNLGKSLEKQIEKRPADKLVCVYSRRNIAHPLARQLKQLPLDKDWDVALIALGSYQDIAQYQHLFACVNTVDCYDVSENLSSYKHQLAKIKTRGTLSIVGAGWDPGLLDIVRKTMGYNAVTLWGKGVSLGHSNTLRSIPGVLDAVQITQPKDNALQLIASGQTNDLHRRICYVSAVERDKENISQQIAKIGHYFEGQNFEIVFCSTNKVRQIKENTQHKGQVLCFDSDFTAKYCVEMDSNNDFTASIMLRYANIIPRLIVGGYEGALDTLDIPLRYL